MPLFNLFKSKGRDLEELARRLALSVEDLHRIQPAYTERNIPKRSGGLRRLLIPSSELKALQRRILMRLLDRLKAHPAATGFEKRHSIVTNAAAHAGKQVVIGVDIQDFFVSTTTDRVDAYFRAIGWNKEASALLAKLCTHENGLPQGAPTSPRLSNLVNLPLDAYLAKSAQKRGIAYSRYADDITYSCDNTGEHRAVYMISVTASALRKFGYTMHRNKKLRLMRQHHCQRVTGLVVNDRPQLPRETRRWLRAVQHKQAATGDSSLTLQQLQGWFAYSHMIQTQRDQLRSE